MKISRIRELLYICLYADRRILDYDNKQSIKLKQFYYGKFTVLLRHGG